MVFAAQFNLRPAVVSLFFCALASGGEQGLAQSCQSQPPHAGQRRLRPTPRGGNIYLPLPYTIVKNSLDLHLHKPY